MVSLRQVILGVSIHCANSLQQQFPSDSGMRTSKTWCLLFKVNSPLPCLQKNFTLTAHGLEEWGVNGFPPIRFGGMFFVWVSVLCHIIQKKSVLMCVVSHHL